MEIQKSNKNERDTKNVLSGRIEKKEPEACRPVRSAWLLVYRCLLSLSLSGDSDSERDMDAASTVLKIEKAGFSGKT